MPELPLLALQNLSLLPQHHQLQSSLHRRKKRSHHRPNLHPTLHRRNLQKNILRTLSTHQPRTQTLPQHRHQTLQQTQKRTQHLQRRLRLPPIVRTPQKILRQQQNQNQNHQPQRIHRPTLLTRNTTARTRRPSLQP